MFCKDCYIELTEMNKHKKCNRCITCQSNVNKEYKLKNKVYIAEYKKQYAIDHSELIKKNQKNYVSKNRDKLNEYQKNYKKLKRMLTDIVPITKPFTAYSP